MKFVNYLKTKGIKHTLWVFWNYKVEKLIFAIVRILFKYRQLKNIILIESHNDFDMNGGTFYRYLIDNQLNTKYTIVWMVRKKHTAKLPSNVKTVPLLGPSIRRSYYQSVAKFAFFDNNTIEKTRDDQLQVYLGHATRAMKDCRGLVDISPSIDYIISSSSGNNQLMSEVYNADIEKFIITGFPVTDVLFEQSNELSKLSLTKSRKIIIWMPTFRKSNNSFGRSDGNTSKETGLPLITNSRELEVLDNVLTDNDAKLIIKLHPAQALEEIKVESTDNIIIASPQFLKERDIDTYRLLSETDALISDYSSISFDYLLLDRPIAYVLSDLKEYKLGFAVDNPYDYMPGDYIYTMEDMIKFLEDVANGVDKHKKERNILKDKIHTYQDGKACERIVKFLNL